MSELSLRLSDAMDALTGDRSSTRPPRAVKQAIERERGRGLVVAERLNAGALAAHTGLMNTGMLSKEEELLLQFAPTGDARYKAIVDAYAIFAAREVGRL